MTANKCRADVLTDAIEQLNGLLDSCENGSKDERREARSAIHSFYRRALLAASPVEQPAPRADALTEAERLLLARVNDCTKPIDAADRNGILKLIDRLAASPSSQPAAAPIARVQVCGDEITLSATSDQRAVLMTMHDAPIYAEPPAATSANETGEDGAAELESMTRMFHAACYDLGLINEALGLDPDDGGAEPILDAIAELRAQIASAQTDEPVAWAVYNGWSRICFYMTEEDARDHAQKAQKNHDLSGSLAAFRVVPLYAAPQPAQADAREPHSDDVAVDSFATAMKHKLALARAKGRGGWETCSPADLSRMLREHVEKGDPRDVANFCVNSNLEVTHLGRCAAH
ncbi:TPA: hypothetical protein ACKFZV_001351 [Burkholderia multivorans]